MGKVYSINVSKRKSVSKDNVDRAMLIVEHGIEGDAHAASGDRQVSLLAIESINKQLECPKAKKKNVSLSPGDFAENITTQGLEVARLKIGDKFKVGSEAILEISKIGKECHRYCSIYYKTGDCIMPREGIFARVLKGGAITVGDDISEV